MPPTARRWTKEVRLLRARAAFADIAIAAGGIWQPKRLEEVVLSKHPSRSFVEASNKFGKMARDGFVPDSATIQANPTRIVFDTLRGEGSKPIVQGALSGTYVLVEVAVPAEAKGIVLRIEPNESRALTTSADGFVSFLMKREDLPQTATIEYEQSGDRKQRTIDFRDLEKKS